MPNEPIVNIREEEQRSRGVLLKVARVAFLVLFCTVTLLDILSYNQRDPLKTARVFSWPITVTISGTLATIVILADMLTPRKKVSTLFSIFLGLVGALVGTLIVGQVLDLLRASYAIEDGGMISLIKVLIGIGLSYLAIATVLQTQDDFRLVIPYVEFARQVRGPRPMILDTSSLIDGRIHDLAQTGLVTAPLVVPTFVVTELQALADSSDKLKRGRGRRGLSMIERLQSSAAIDVMIDDTNLAEMPVDQMLLELARTMPGIIVTTDSGLARVADIQKIPVLNLHDIAAAMRPQVVAGETMRIAVIRTGEHDGQAVGYLDDGTMVVVDNGAAHIGSEVDAVVTSTLQTNAGRMIFAKLPPPDKMRAAIAPQAPATLSAAAPPAAVGVEHQAAEPGEPDEEQDQGEDGPRDPMNGQPAPPVNEPTPPGPTSLPAPTSNPAAPLPGAPKPGPFPVKPPRSIRGGTPRNPRR